MNGSRMRAVLVAACVGLGVAAPPAAAQKIQPGESIVADGSFCTLNWIYDGPGGVYAGTAAHCVEGVGQSVSLASGSLGEELTPIGTVAFRGDPDAPGRDYAFISVDPANLGLVDPSLKGHPNIPTGVSGNPQKGDLMQFSGNGVGFHLSQPTRESRVGVLNYFDESEQLILGGVSPGDSGGPVADITDGNTAFGIVATVGVGVNSGALTIAHVGEGGPLLSFVLADAAARGFPVTLRTV